MKLKIVKFFLFGSVLVTCFASLMSYSNYIYYSKQALKLDSLHAIVLRSTEILSLMKDGETGTRGYLLTQDTNYLEPYKACKLGVQSIEEKLTGYLVQDQGFKGNLAEISRLITSKQDIMAKTIALNENAGPEAAVRFVKTNLGKWVMDSLRVEVAKLISKEEDLLNRTANAYELKLRWMNRIHYCIQAFVIAMTLTAIFALTRKQREINSMFRELQKAKDNLELEVEERTRELHHANLELVAQNEEITSQTEQISVQNDKLRILNEEKNRFIAIASHDMKSPLNRIQGLLSIVIGSPNAVIVSQSEYFEMMLDTITGMKKLINNILDINKINDRGQQPKMDRFDMVAFGREMLMIFKNQASEKQIQLLFTSNQPVIEIVSDRAILSQIMENLLSNAIKFSKQGKEIRIQMKLVQNQIKFSIIDQGPGIAQEEMGLLFGKFQKLSARPTGGESSSGLGLSIVKDLVESMAGNIQCNSVLGKGSVFTVTLPLH